MGRRIDGQMPQYHRKTMRTVRRLNRNVPGEGWKILELAASIIRVLSKTGHLNEILKYRRQPQEELAT